MPTYVVCACRATVERAPVGGVAAESVEHILLDSARNIEVDVECVGERIPDSTVVGHLDGWLAMQQ